jgi:hypothetical protein
MAHDQLSALRDHHGFAIEVDLVEPDFDLLAIEQILLEKGAVLFGHAFKEAADFCAILWYESSNRDRRAVRQLQNLRISGEEILLNRIVTHRQSSPWVDLADNRTGRESMEIPYVRAARHVKPGRLVIWMRPAESLRRLGFPKNS